MPLKLASAVRGTVVGHRLGALEGGGGSPRVWTAFLGGGGGVGVGILGGAMGSGRVFGRGGGGGLQVAIRGVTCPRSQLLVNHRLPLPPLARPNLCSKLVRPCQPC